MSYAPQSSPPLRRLPACAIAVAMVFASPARAQETQPLAVASTLHAEPEGAALVSLPAGLPVRTGRVRDGWHQATIEGWITTASIERTARSGFDVVVTSGDGENLRQSPNGPIVGRAREGTLFERVDQRGRWTRVRRAGWIRRQAIARPAQQPAPQKRSAAAQPETPAAAPDSALSGRLRTGREVQLGATPDGPAVASLREGTTAHVVARAGDYAKVRVEGWVPADALTGSDDGALVGVTADELHAQPDRYVGQTLEWRLQVIAVKRADELRPEMPADTPYLLTRGPLPEPGFVYVMIPPSRQAEFQSLPPLQELVVRATVRAARTRFLTTPVVELVSVVSGIDGKQVTP